MRRADNRTSHATTLGRTEFDPESQYVGNKRTCSFEALAYDYLSTM